MTMEATCTSIWIPLVISRARRRPGLSHPSPPLRPCLGDNYRPSSAFPFRGLTIFDVIPHSARPAGPQPGLSGQKHRPRHSAGARPQAVLRALAVRAWPGGGGVASQIDGAASRESRRSAVIGSLRGLERQVGGAEVTTDWPVVVAAAGRESPNQATRPPRIKAPSRSACCGGTRGRGPRDRLPHPAAAARATAARRRRKDRPRGQPRCSRRWQCRCVHRVRRSARWR
jgi:hypothetical protein